MKNIFFIVSVLLKNKIKDFFFITIIVSSVLFGIILIVSTKIFVGEKYKIFIDTGIFLINAILLITSVLLSAEFITELKKSKFLNWLFSLPLKKGEFFIGVFLSFSISILFILIIYAGIFLLTALFFNLHFNISIFLYFILCYLKFILLGAIGLILSINYNFFPTILSEAGIFIIGSSIINFIKYAETGHGLTSMQSVIKILYFIFPDFKIPYLAVKISHFLNVPTDIFFKSFSYYITYIVFTLIIGLIWIERKNFS